MMTTTKTTTSEGADRMTATTRATPKAKKTEPKADTPKPLTAWASKEWVLLASGPTGQICAKCHDLPNDKVFHAKLQQWVDDLADKVVVAVHTQIRRTPLELVDVYFAGYGSTGQREGLKPPTVQRAFHGGQDINEANIKVVGFASDTKTRWSLWGPDFEAIDSPLIDATQRDYVVDNPPQFVRGVYTKHADPMGVMAMQYAVNNGAEQIELYGFDGYEPRQDGDCKYWQRWEQINEFQRGAMQRVVDACPDVAFIFHSSPEYIRLTGENVTYVT